MARRPCYAHERAKAAGCRRGCRSFASCSSRRCCLAAFYGGASLYFNEPPAPGDIPPHGVPAAQWRPNPLWLPSYAAIELGIGVRPSADGFIFTGRMGRALYGVSRLIYRNAAARPDRLVRRRGGSKIRRAETVRVNRGRKTLHTRIYFPDFGRILLRAYPSALELGRLVFCSKKGCRRYADDRMYDRSARRHAQRSVRRPTEHFWHIVETVPAPTWSIRLFSIIGNQIRCRTRRSGVALPGFSEPLDAERFQGARQLAAHDQPPQPPSAMRRTGASNYQREERLPTAQTQAFSRRKGPMRFCWRN